MIVFARDLVVIMNVWIVLAYRYNMYVNFLALH